MAKDKRKTLHSFLCYSKFLLPSYYIIVSFQLMRFPGGSAGKENAYSAGYLHSIPGLGRSRGEGNGSPLQYSCLENPMDCSLPGSPVHGIARVRHDLVTKPAPKDFEDHCLDPLLLRFSKQYFTFFFIY